MPKFKQRRYDKNKVLKNRRGGYYIINNNSDSSHLYYDINVFNNTTGFNKTGTAVPTRSSVPCEFNQMRTKFYLDNPYDYGVTVVDFNIDSNSFPNQIVQPKIGVPKNIDGSYQTVYTLYYGSLVDTNFYPKNVSWKPADLELQANPPTTGSDLVTSDMISNEYFWNYSYQYFLDILNNILANEGIYTSFRYSGKTGLITLESYDPDPLEPRIFVNEQLYNLLAGFQYNYYATLGDIVGPVYELIPTGVFPYYPYKNGYTSFAEPLTATYNNFYTIQSYPSTQLWNPAVSIVFTSKSLGVVSDDDFNPYIFGLNPNKPSNNSNISNTVYEYILGRRADPVINYKDINYLFKNMLSNLPIDDLNLGIYWKDDYGNLHDFFLESGSNFKLKLLFRKHKFEED
jgi:hypothetical protein